MRLRVKSDIGKCGERIVDGAIVAPQTGHRGAQRRAQEKSTEARQRKHA